MTDLPTLPSEFPDPASRGERAVLESELADVERRLEKADRAYRRHVTWVVLGMSPSLLLPALFALTEWGGGAVVAVVLIVCVLESARALRSKREVGRLERQAMALRADLEALESGARDLLPGDAGP